MSKEAKQAILLTTICSFAYLFAYLARSILGAVSPMIEEAEVLTIEQIGLLNSSFCITYGVGQLINGLVGERIKSRIMISGGLMAAAVLTFLFIVCVGNEIILYLIYALTGFTLSMLYAPIVKVVAENVKKEYASRCSLGYSFAAYVASPLVGVMAVAFEWDDAFLMIGILLALMSIICFVSIQVLENKGIVRYGTFKKEKTEGKKVKLLIEKGIIKMSIISAITGIVRTSVVFWLPIFYAEYLSLPADSATLLFSLTTLINAFSVFVGVFIYEKLHRSMRKTMFLGLLASAISFFGVFSLGSSKVSIILMMSAIFWSNVACTMIWSCYCPNMRDTGLTSSVTGYLDFISYMAASLSSIIFANAVEGIGWKNLILVWTGIMLIGVFTILPIRRKK